MNFFDFIVEYFSPVLHPFNYFLLFFASSFCFWYFIRKWWFK